LTFFSDPLQRIRTGLTARVPFIIGNTQDDGTLSAFNMTDLAAFLVTIFGSFPTADEVRSLYPSGLNDNAIISEAFRDFGNLCPAGLWAGAAVGAGVTNVYRYTYGTAISSLASLSIPNCPRCSQAQSSLIFSLSPTPVPGTLQSSPRYSEHSITRPPHRLKWSSRTQCRR
ncbi:hypothetical protein K438DRAFT_2103037, partial [Mycena galopus ATCC 62051]